MALLCTSVCWLLLALKSALAKDAGNDEDMVEMINSEIESLTNQIKELEDKLKVIPSFW